MAKYSSKPVKVAKSAEELFDRFSNIGNLRDQLENAPSEIRDKMGNVRFTDDAVVLITPQVGEIEFGVKSKNRPDSIVLEARRSPVPLELTVNFNPTAPDSTEVTAAIDVEIPMMLKPLVGPKLQEAANMFGDMVAKVTS